MTLKQALSQAREIFAVHSVADPVIESELLLMAALNISRVQLYLQLENKLNSEPEGIFWQLVKRCLNQEPTAYIMGHREFYGLDFYVTRDVLIPRPESELLVEKALQWAQKHPMSTIADIGTGCGAIAVSLALNLPQTKIYATDVSPAALRVAALNCQKHGVASRICLLEGDLLSPLPEPVNLIVANLPYVKESELAQLSTVNFEPTLALNGGSDGLEKIRRLCLQIRGKLCSRGYLLVEIGQGQRRAVTTFLRHLFPSAEIEVTPDLRGIDRVVSLDLTTTAAKEV